MNDHALCHFFCENRFTESKLRRMSAQSRCYSRVKSRMLLRFALKKSRRTSIGCGVMNSVWQYSSFYPKNPSEATEAPGEAWTAIVIDMVDIHRSSIYWRILRFGDAQIHLRNSTPQARISNVDLKMDLWIFSWNIRLIRKDLEQEYPDLEFPKSRFQIQG